MDQPLLEAAELVEGLRYLDDVELINEDIVGCAANATDIIHFSTGDSE